MATSNFLLWNPTQSNQETDAQYNADPTRAGGAGVDGLFSSSLANKAFYQWATFVYCFGQMMAAKGYAMSDASPSALIAALANVQTAADQKPDLIQVPYSPNLQFDCSKANGFQVTLTGNVSSLSIINATMGQLPINIVFTQSGAGSYTVPWPSNLKGAGTIDPGVGNNSVQAFIVLADGNLHANSPMVVS